MKSRFKHLITWILLLSLVLSTAYPLCFENVYAADEQEDTGITAGYITTPEEEEISCAGTDIDYRTAMERLEGSVSDKGSEHLYAARPDDEFPCYYTEDWLSYFDEKYPPTRDQGKYATCWAESAMSLAEFYMIRNGLADKSIDYSELHLAYWTYTQGSPSAAAGDTKDKVIFTPSSEKEIENILDNGGSLKFAVESLMRNRGFASEKSAPYSGAESVANGNPLSEAMERTDVAYLKNACLIPIRFKPDNVKQAIVENGAAGIAIYANRDNYNEEYNTYYSSSENSTNHALTIVGWDDFFPGQRFCDAYGNKPPLDGAWLVRNSYSTENKEDYSSYFWLSYFDKTISGAWVFQLMDSFPWDNHYYYDSQIHGNTYYDNVCEYANVFTVGGEGQAEGERLEAVIFEMALVEDTGSHYTIKIYGGLTGDTPDTGTLIRTASAEGTIYYEGFYTVSLNSPVVFDKGEKFAVVVSFDGPGSSVVLETAVEEYNCISSKVGISTGQSFVSTDRETWADTKSSEKNHGNLVIAAMTSDTEKKAAVSKVVLTPENVTFTSPDESVDASVKLLDTNGEESAESEYSYVIWSSGNSKVAVVDEFGHITPVGNGQTSVSAKYGKLSASCEVRVAIPEEGRTAVPVADLRPDSELDWQNSRLKLSCSTPGAAIYYTLDGSDVTKKSTRYSGEISFSPLMAGGDIIVKAMASAYGYKDSESVEFKYSLPAKGKLRIPVPAKGTVIKSTATGYLSLSAKMTINEEDDTPLEGFSWTVSDESILKIYAGEDGKSGAAKLTGLKNGITVVSVNALDSLGERLDASISISVDIATTGDVHISPLSGNYLYAGDHISISCDTPEASIYYTLDGSAATPSGLLYTGDIIVGPDSVGSQITVNSIAVKEGMYASESVSCCYSVKRGKPGRSPHDSLPDAADDEGYIYLVKGQSFYPDSSVNWICKGRQNVVSINKKGLVKAKNAGMARIESRDDPEVYMNFIVAVPSVMVDKKTLAVGEEGEAVLSCFLNGIDKTDKFPNIHWFSSDDTVLEVYDDGSYKAIGNGSAKIAVYVNGKEYAVKVRVKDQVKVPALTLSENRVDLVLNPLQSGRIKIKGLNIKKCQIDGTGVYPSEYNKKGVPVVFQNEVIRITSAGKVTALSPGTTTLILSSEAEPENPVFVDVYVREPAERVYYMMPGKTRKIRIKGLKTTGKDTAEIFSTNEDVVCVDKGKIICRDKEGESLVVCSYKGFDFVIRVYVNYAELKTDDKLRAKGKDYELVLKLGDEPYELNWIGEHAQKAEFINRDNTVAFMDQYEVIYIRGKGKTTLTAKVHGKKIKIRLIVN